MSPQQEPESMSFADLIKGPLEEFRTQLQAA
jgi:hypothetical protein